MVLEHLSDTFEPIFKPFFNFFDKMTFQKITLSYSKHTFWHFRTLGHLNGSSSFNIHHRDLSMVPFNSELNSTHFWWKNWAACKTCRSPTQGKSVFNALSPKALDKYAVEVECCLFFSSQLPFTVSCGSTPKVVITWETQVFDTW